MRNLNFELFVFASAGGAEGAPPGLDGFGPGAQAANEFSTLPQQRRSKQRAVLTSELNPLYRKS